MRAKLCAVILLLLTFSSSFYPQASSAKGSWWFTTGLRVSPNSAPPIGSVKEEKKGLYDGMFHDFGMHISFNFAAGPIYGQAFITGETIPYDHYYSYEQVIVGLAAGERYSKRFISASFFAGPSLNFEHAFSLHPEHPVYLGVHLNQQIFFKPLPYIGFGVEFMENINAYKSFASYHFTVMLGNGL